ncbi:MAG TPA: hypothetical protein VGE74_19660 [Gemmata sp.]
MRHPAFILTVAVCASPMGCEVPGHYSAIALTDSRLDEFSDLHSIDRPALGLPPLPVTADVRVERSYGHGGPYDAMLHVYAHPQPSRTIAFCRRDGKMKWIGEQVTVYGPRQYTDCDGTQLEHVTLTYETSRVAHYRLNQLNVSYWGPDAELRAKWEPTLADVKPLLDQWLAQP